jgi:hypothetical protein
MESVNIRLSMRIDRKRDISASSTLLLYLSPFLLLVLGYLIAVLIAGHNL